MNDEDIDPPITYAELNDGMRVAEAALSAGRWLDALATYRRLLERILEGRVYHGRQWRGADLQIIERLAELAALCCLIEAVDNLLLGMVLLALDAGNQLCADYTQLKRAEMRLAGGDTRAAFILLESLAPSIGELQEIEISALGLPQWEAKIAWRDHARGDRNMLLIRAYVCMGHVLLNYGRYADALQLLAQGLVHAASSDNADFAGQAKRSLYLLRARAQLEIGQLADARTSLMRVAPDELAVAARIGCHELSAKILFLQGRLGQAADSFSAARDACARAGFPRAQAVAALNLAHASVLLNKVGDALALCAEATQIAHALGDCMLAGLASTIGQIAEARRSSAVDAVAIRLTVKDMVENATPERAAAPVLQAGLGTSTDGASFLSMFEDGALAFLWMLDRAPRAAEAQLAALRTICSGSDSPMIAVRLRVMAGQLAATRGQHTAALGYFEPAMQELAQLGLVHELWQVTQFHVRCLIRLGRESEVADTAAAAEHLLEELCATLPPADRAVFLLNKYTAQEEYLVAQLDRLLADAAAGAVGGLLGRWRSRYRVLRRLRELLTTLARNRMDMADRQCGRPQRVMRARPGLLHFAGAMGRHPRDRATIVFVVLPDRVLIIWTAFLAMGFLTSPITLIALRGLVRQWHESTQDALSRIEAGMTQAQLAALDEESAGCMARLAGALRLEALLAALPASVTRLGMVTDDVLHGVPFGALPCGGGLLIERFAISSAFEIDPVAERGEGGEPATTGLVVGVAETPGYDELPAVGEECHQVMAWMARQGLDATCLRDHLATVPAVMERLSDAGFAHFACHGDFRPEQPDRSGIILQGADTAGCLSIRALAQLRLARCQHVTFAACWSGDSFVLPARWIISLPEVFWRSGAQSILASLWQVVDEVSGPLCERFYRNLDTMPRDLALRDAQLACLRGELIPAGPNQPPASLPFFWAGFALYGSPHPVRRRLA